MFADVEQGFMPWLMDSVEERLTHVVLGRTVLDQLIRDIVQERQGAYATPVATPKPGTPATQSGSRRGSKAGAGTPKPGSQAAGEVGY